MEGNAVIILYSNSRGETRLCRVIPNGVRYASIPWRQPLTLEWILDAYDAENGANLLFSMRNILAWTFPPDAPTADETPQPPLVDDVQRIAPEPALSTRQAAIDAYMHGHRSV